MIEDETDKNLRVPVTSRLCNATLYSGKSHSCRSLTVPPLALPQSPPTPIHHHTAGISALIPIGRSANVCTCLFVCVCGGVRVRACAPWTSLECLCSHWCFSLITSSLRGCLESFFLFFFACCSAKAVLLLMNGAFRRRCGVTCQAMT